MKKNLIIICTNLRVLLTSAMKFLWSAKTLVLNNAEFVHENSLHKSSMSMVMLRVTSECEDGKNIAVIDNDYIADNPWLAIATAAVFGMLTALIMSLNN